MDDWDSQARQYDPSGPPGVHLEQHTVQTWETVIDCLLYRDEHGELLGILNRYHEGNLFQRPGSCNLWVKPTHHRRGIASILLRDAWHRWGDELRYEHQTWTTEGNSWLEALVAKGKIDAGRKTSLNEEYWKPQEPQAVQRWWQEAEHG